MEVLVFVNINMKEYGGASICEHKRRINLCKECGGCSICEHKRIRSSCKERRKQKYEPSSNICNEYEKEYEYMFLDL